MSLQVELHVHLDGSMRRETLWELLKQKNLPLPGDGSFRAFEKAVSVQKPKDLGHFLSAFPIFLPAIKWVNWRFFSKKKRIGKCKYFNYDGFF